ncbi:hypothetical protein BTHE68_55120 [Burkholderia sp. THE68]|nr:hypothetical protein BTHE68_55120 [Burkholderia sp. THE68]
MATQCIARLRLDWCCGTRAVRKHALSFARLTADSFDARREKRRGIDTAIDELGTQ